MLYILLLASVELLKSAPKKITLLPYPPLGCVKLPLESNPIPYPEYLYLSMSASFVNLTAPNRQFSKVTPQLLMPGGKQCKCLLLVRDCMQLYLALKDLY